MKPKGEEMERLLQEHMQERETLPPDVYRRTQRAFSYALPMRRAKRYRETAMERHVCWLLAILALLEIATLVLVCFLPITWSWLNVIIFGTLCVQAVTLLGGGVGTAVALPYIHAT